MTTEMRTLQFTPQQLDDIRRYVKQRLIAIDEALKTVNRKRWRASEKAMAIAGLSSDQQMLRGLQLSILLAYTDEDRILRGITQHPKD